MSKKDNDIIEYTNEIEDLFVQFLISDGELFARCRGILNPKSFSSKQNQKVIDFLVNYSNTQSILPTIEQIAAVTGKKIEVLRGLNEQHTDWFLSEFETFSRHKALETAILESTDLLEKKNYGDVEKKIKDAVSIGLVKNLGTEYFKDPKSRIERLKDRGNMVSTGWRDIDDKLFGGFERGTLSIFAGQSGSGKSLMLQNLALNWAMLGLNVVYITLELSEDLCALRLDAMTSGYSTKEVFKHTDDVELRVKKFQKEYKGNIRIKQLPSGVDVNDIRAFLKELEIQTERKIDAVLVDYLDLCSPISKKVSLSDLFIKDKYVSEELRNLAIEKGILMVTASQLNRQSHEEIEFDHSHISGGISKINTSDNVLAIFTTYSMKESGRYQIQFMKTRSSSGVGSKIDLKFDIKSLRIMDLEDGEKTADEAASENIVEALKRKPTITVSKPMEDKKTDILTDGPKLMDLIRKIR